ncbi:2'-5'-oligoadenylate synthase 1 isoform X6 [Pongo abelii]|uniref:2'-5'-oligoadenylate synthase 1 isoform X6 n=1 Tax=Pongo abelii TaxID=9601 RepID=UPI0023E8EAE3|nr:2'-5'-oligoadenylate synthase 1 isoform X6 [Pongo abelii]
MKFSTGIRGVSDLQKENTKMAPPFRGNETNSSPDSVSRRDKSEQVWEAVLLPLSLLSMMDLRNTPAKSLDKFIEDYLLPDTHFRMQINHAIDTICGFLKERCFRGSSYPARVSKVVKGGSSGKGTALRGRSDADLVVFLSPLTTFQDQLNRRGEFIQEIRKQLEACQRERAFSVKFEVQAPRWDNPRALSFVLSSFQLREGVEFDVLPAFDALAHRGVHRPAERGRVLHLLHRTTERLPEAAPHQAQEPHPPSQALVPKCMALPPDMMGPCKKKLGKLPPQYALELLTVYAWERGSMKTHFNTAQGFRTVLELVINYQQLCIYWTKYYDFENPIIKKYLSRQLRKPRPVILDPADPTGNLGGGDPIGWRQLAQEAEAWLNYPCFKNWDGSPVSSWILLAESDSEDDETYDPRMYPKYGYIRTHEYSHFSHSPSTLQAASTPQAEENWTCTIL